MKLENLKKPHIIILAVCAVLALISVIFTGVRLYKINFLDSELEKLYAKEEEYENQALWDDYDVFEEDEDDEEDDEDEIVPDAKDLPSVNLNDYDDTDADDEDDADVEDDTDIEEDDTDVDDSEDDSDSEDQDPNMPSGVLDYDDEGWWDLEGEYHWLEEEGTPSWWGSVSHDEDD